MSKQRVVLRPMSEVPEDFTDPIYVRYRNEITGERHWDVVRQDFWGIFKWRIFKWIDTDIVVDSELETLLGWVDISEEEIEYPK